MASVKILVIDDEPNVLNLVSAYLKQDGYMVYTATDGPSGLQAAKVYQPDLVILDVMLPGLDGIEVLTRLRRESNVYIIMLTAKTEETDRVIGLSVGADDYVTKPFSPRELVARVKAALRRLQAEGGHAVGNVMNFEHVRIDSGSRRTWLDEKEIELTTIEFDLLRVLAEHRGMVLSREQLLEKVWGYDYYGEIRVVDVHIGHVRQKLGDESLVTTVRGIGYRFEDKPV